MCHFPSLPVDGVALDGDNPEHIQWVFQRAQERAAEFSITGVTYRLTQGELPPSFNGALSMWCGWTPLKQVMLPPAWPWVAQTYWHSVKPSNRLSFILLCFRKEVVWHQCDGSKPFTIHKLYTTVYTIITTHTVVKHKETHFVIHTYSVVNPTLLQFVSSLCSLVIWRPYNPLMRFE